MEYYLGTIPFKPDPNACTLQFDVVPVTEQDNPSSRTSEPFAISTFSVDMKDRPFTSPTEVAEALSAEIKGEISQSSTDASLVVSYGNGDSNGHKSFSVKNTSTSPFKLRLKNNEASILAKLGFTTGCPQIELGPGDERHAKPGWEIGNANQPGGRSLEDQRIRSDPAFTKLRALFHSKFGGRGGKKRRSHNILTPGENIQQKPVALHDGHLLLAEYLFSLTCLSMFRQDNQTMQMINGTAEYLESLVTDDILATFDRRLHDVSCFNIGTESKPYCCSISSVVNFVKEKYMSAAQKDLNDANREAEANAEGGCLRFILEEKLKAAAVAEHTSAEESWFTETDRILRNLCRVDSGRGHGRMVVMRVYEIEEQLTMQHCLRQAATKLHFTTGDLEHPLFSVLCDNGDTNLSQDIEAYFRHVFNLRPDGEGHFTLKDRMEELRNSPGSTSTSLSYEDLKNVPMILILCEKGRMGDTFPHSLGCFDLRLRVAGFFSSFEQELGRLCRYPEFRLIEGGSGLSHDDAKTKGYEALDRKRLVKVITSTPAGIVAVVDTKWQLDSTLDSVGEHVHVTLEEAVFPLPTALIPSPTMKKLTKAIGEHRRTGTPISKCIRMEKMDLHMHGSTTVKNKPITADENELHNYLAYKPSDKHYDRSRSQSTSKDPRRLILSAECADC